MDPIAMLPGPCACGEGRKRGRCGRKCKEHQHPRQKFLPPTLPRSSTKHRTTKEPPLLKAAAEMQDIENEPECLTRDNLTSDYFPSITRGTFACVGVLCA